MPTINFNRVRQMISLGDVLRVIGYQKGEIIGVGVRGPCPLYCHADPRCCKLSWAEDRWYCHRCRKGGGALELYMKYRGKTLFIAALELCRLLGRPVPWMPRFRTRRHDRGSVCDGSIDEPGTGDVELGD